MFENVTRTSITKYCAIYTSICSYINANGNGPERYFTNAQIVMDDNKHECEIYQGKIILMSSTNQDVVKCNITLQFNEKLLEL